MKRLSMVRHPTTCCTPFMFCIRPNLMIAEIFSGLASMPRLETIKPSSIPPWDPENALLGVELDAICLEFCKGLLKVDYELVNPSRLDHDVVHIGLNGSPDEVSEILEHTTLVCRPYVFQTE